MSSSGASVSRGFRLRVGSTTRWIAASMAANSVSLISVNCGRFDFDR
jgi:hypothetical protein